MPLPVCFPGGPEDGGQSGAAGVGGRFETGGVVRARMDRAVPDGADRTSSATTLADQRYRQPPLPARPCL
jgi:hypothetical protein